jgi:hypothetical protein
MADDATTDDTADDILATVFGVTEVSVIAPMLMALNVPVYDRVKEGGETVIAVTKTAPPRGLPAIVTASPTEN